MSNMIKIIQAVAKQQFNAANEMITQELSEKISDASVNSSKLSEFFQKYNFNNLHSKIESAKNKFNEHDKNITVKSLI